eukprot:NODE_13485_length_1163_cov_1.852317.p1 GENE.NODE_13485_length_1163_cov_1.852317~~NODE_13485_length_1163_cov_1.852317.p1  ORF type:complete len:382 (-),score=81.81 NODE_13485_length_1163_cov_1.852317:17-1090(-)
MAMEMLPALAPASSSESDDGCAGVGGGEARVGGGGSSGGGGSKRPHPAAPLPPSVSASSSESGSDGGETPEDEEKQEYGGAVGKRRRLAVPGCITGLFARVEDPSAHQGRRRRVAHVDGDFATLVYLAVEPTRRWQRQAVSCQEALRRMAATTEVHLAERSGAPGWHVSLCRLHTLRCLFIDPLLQSLRKIASDIGAPARPLVFDDEHVDVFAAAHAERYFAGVSVAAASLGWVRGLADQVAGAFMAFGVPQEGSTSELSAGEMQPHCSLAWTLADLAPALAAVGAARHSSAWGVSWRVPGASAGLSSGGVPRALSVRGRCVKVGDRVTGIPLPGAEPTVLPGVGSASGSEASSDED